MQHLFFRNGKINIFAWILFISMIVAFAFTIYHCIISVRKLMRDEKLQSTKMAELEFNLRTIMGSQYKQLS